MGGGDQVVTFFGDRRGTPPTGWTKETIVALVGDARIDASAPAGPGATLTLPRPGRGRGRPGLPGSRVTGGGLSVFGDRKKQDDPRVLPDDVDLAEAAGGHHQVGWPLAQHLVGDPVAAQPRVLRLRLHRRLRRGTRLSLHLEPRRTQRSTLVYSRPSGGESGCHSLDQHEFLILRVSNDGRVMASGSGDAYGGMAATRGEALEERRSRGSRPTVGAEGMRSTGPQVCGHRI